MGPMIILAFVITNSVQAFQLGVVIDVGIEPGLHCAESLHILDLDHQMEIVAANTVGDSLVYTLRDVSGKKLAIVECTFPSAASASE